MNFIAYQRRRFIKSAAFGLFGIAAFDTVSGQSFLSSTSLDKDEEKLFYRYPSMDDEIVSSIVGASHGNFDKVKEMVTRRPELAKAAWDWGFGDWETALGAASHVGRRDIAEFLMEHGARPDIFTFTMLGMLKSVQEMVETIPGIQSMPGPHGITLLQHAKNRLNNKSITAPDADNVNKVLNYLESLGNADIKPKSLAISEEEKKTYMGEYRFGNNENELFIVDLHRLGFLQMARKGAAARALNRIDENIFSPAGAPSVSIIFRMGNGKPVSLSIHEPDPVVSAARV